MVHCRAKTETACVSDCGIFQMYIEVIKPQSTMRAHTRKIPEKNQANSTKVKKKAKKTKSGQDIRWPLSKPGTYHCPNEGLQEGNTLTHKKLEVGVLNI